MKKIVLTLLAVSLSLGVMAGEGMWVLPFLQKSNIKDMKSKGLKLSAEDIYSINHSSLKDAIVIFGDGCTGEIVSPEGLIFTNHHCGYDAIQQLSSLEHDYLKNGFWAENREGELPVDGLSVRFIRQMMEVSDQVLGNVPSIAGYEERARIVGENIAAIESALKEQYEGCDILVEDMFGGNSYVAFVIEKYDDVRLVGAPPTSIGKFGGDTDNWMWPRHTGDFSVFRVYADKEGRPARYSEDNVPLQTDTFLKISIKGLREGDFAMVMGFPGMTNRYMTSYEIDRMLEVDNPQRIFIRGERLALLKEDMEADDAVRIKYASKYARSANYWKNSIGKSRGVRKLGVKAKKEAQEASFRQWAQNNTLPEEGYMDALDKLERYVRETRDIGASKQYIAEALLSAVELTMAPHGLWYVATVDDPEMYNFMVGIDIASMYYDEFYKDYNMPTDRKVAYRMFEIMQQNVKDLPSVFADVVDARFGGDTRAYVDWLYDNSVFATREKYNEFAADFSRERFMEDPAVQLYVSVREKYSELNEALAEYVPLYDEGHRLYIAGLMCQNPDKMWYPDANFTMRLTYGNVLPCVPADGMRYDWFTTLKGVMDKEDLSNPTEFTVPERLKELYAAGDYGQYADKDGTMHVCFLADLDITGGNSGSPVLNGRGELIGLAFDGNWEAMSGDIAFEPEVQRCIGVDVRYVLFVIDKFAGAGWLLDEMTIVK
ncbi:MAG: S46 family peptidase [Alistipes sp.]|nr:S46 family peptidase [Alistipes sp.]